MDPSIAAIVLDVRGTVLPGSGDAPMPGLIARALAELRYAGVAVAFITGSGRRTVRGRVVPPLVRAASGTGGGGPVSFYVDHGASAFRFTRSSRLVPLAGYRPRTLRRREFGLLLRTLTGEGPWTPDFRGYERKPGQVNCMVDAPWPARRKAGRILRRRLREARLRRLRVSVPSSRRRVDVALADKARAVRHVLARFAANHPERLVIIGDSLQRAGSDAPMLRAATGALAVQVGYAVPLRGVLHLPGGPRATWAVLRTLARIAAQGRHALTRAAAAAALRP